jgi:multiple antibiotic resistance protein
MKKIEFALFCLSSLFVIVDPLAAIPAFLCMTAKVEPDRRLRTAQVASAVTALVLISFAAEGRLAFRVLGITVEAFQIAGGAVLFFIAFDMLQAHRSPIQETPEERLAGEEEEEVGVTPLAIPMLAGPGAISTVILLEQKTRDLLDKGILYGSILVVAGLCYVILGIAARRGSPILGPLAFKLLTRLMGLLLAAVAVQFVLDGLAAYWKGVRL